MALLQLRRVWKVYRTGGAVVEALRDVSLEVFPGEFIAVVGRSGGGKSTLLNLCGAMDFPTSGEVVLDGKVTSKLADNELSRLRRNRVGFVFQSFQLIHTLSAIENVELPLLLAHRSDARREGLKRLAWVDLAGEANRFPHQLSGGQQQRVAIARALIHDPQLLLADEPTGNLDTATSEMVLNLLRRAARDLKVAVLVATHSQEIAEVADRVIRVRDGAAEELLPKIVSTASNWEIRER